MKICNSLEELKVEVKGSISIDGEKLHVTDEHRFRNQETDKLIYNAVFSSDALVRSVSRWMIWEASILLGCPSSSINDLYMARARNEWKDMTVPAVNLRGLTYDIARTIFKTLKKNNAPACIFEIAKSEMNYTEQSPEEYVACVLAAALRENWKFPVFIQGDHFQVNAKKFLSDKNSEINSIKELISDAMSAGFFNIDIDSSTLVDLSKNNVEEQQKNNFEVAAELTKYIRELEPKGVTVSVGAEIGEVGTQNSTPEELTAFMEGYQKTLGEKITGISKISIQTGTSHGGIPLPDGSIANVALDLEVIDKLGDIARTKFGVGGVVQHGASTLPATAFDNFPKHQTMEVHLATGFQNTIFDSTNFPKNLRMTIYKWLDENLAKEKKPDMTPEQFYYKTRKSAFGVFKKELWSLTDNTKTAIMGELARQFEMLFTKLNIANTNDLFNRHIKPVAIHKPFPSGSGKNFNIEADDNPNAD